MVAAGHRRRGSAGWACRSCVPFDRLRRVVRFNDRGPEGLLDGKAPGRQSLLNDAQRRALVEIVEQGPIPAIHGVVRWRLIDLVQWLYDEFAVSLDVTTVGRELRRLGYVKLELCLNLGDGVI